MTNGFRSVWAVKVLLLGSTLAMAHTADATTLVPPPAMDEASTGSNEVAVLAGGCFWGVQNVFQHVKGVQSAVSGYSGGAANTATYATVSRGASGHAESVRISFDPRVITYGKILQIYFSVVADPTELNRQGPDTGTQYRSAIFTASQKQQEVANAYVSQLDKAGVYAKPIVTQVTAFNSFYPAEAYHQDFATLHPDNSYIAINDAPKADALRRLFPDAYRETPVLVQQAGLTH